MRVSCTMKVGHMARDCKAAFTATTQRAPVPNQRNITCYECGRQGHIKSECPKLKNHNRRNQTGINEARGRAYAIGGGEVNPDSNVVTGTFLLNNRYASILFDSVVDRNFLSTTIGTLIDIVPTTLDISYTIKIADGRVVEFDTIIRGCTLKLVDHLFNIDLMPIELSDFNVIIGMDWLSMYHEMEATEGVILVVPEIWIYYLKRQVQTSSAVASLFLSSGNLSSLAVGMNSGSGNSSLAVGMP
nr:reverse transcriptase domain-containing protein [Tanacetum cinerariifolium]